jgi:hypothetical protein
MDSLREPRASGRQVVADNFQSKLESLEGAPPIQLTTRYANQAGGKSADFPARLVPKDSRDDYIVDKEAAYQFEQQKVNKADGANKPQIVRTVGPEDVDYLRRKRAVMNRLEFDQWMLDAIDMSDPVAGKHRTNPYHGTKSFKIKKSRK